jgi:preprotein translocase subunit SecD
MTSARRLLFSTFSLWIIGAAWCVYYLSPLVIPGSAAKPIKFGIDLVGGTYISLIVDTEKAVEDALFERVQMIKAGLKRANMQEPTSVAFEKGEAVLTFAATDGAREASQFIKELSTSEIKQSQSGAVVRLALSTVEETRIKHWAVESNIHVLRNRLDKFSVSEITIAAQGEKNIIIELPNVDDPEKAKAMIGKAAMLEMVLVEAEGRSPEEILEKYDGELPADMRILPLHVKRGFEQERVYYLVPKHAEITGKLLRNANPAFGQYGKMVVEFEFSDEGGRLFYELTSPNVGREIAAILDNEVISAPRVSEPIRKKGNITSDSFTADSAKELADLLKSGSYVAPVSFDEERTVGPSLGAQAIRQGALSCLVGLILLFLFSIIYYKIPGLLAFITLLYNLLLTLVIFSYFGGTLTLPGIAGLVLTLGMAIDASILIYEKIKEDLRRGITIRQAIDNGFAGSLVVILDANITHFIMDVVLYKFGTGAVQGFALTMIVGIVTTLITGLFFLKAFFNFVFNCGVKSMKF